MPAAKQKDAGSRIRGSMRELREMDTLADGTSPVHARHPLAKLAVTIAYVLTVVSFQKYDLTRLFVMVLYPAVLFSVTGLRLRTCLWKLRVVLPLVMAVGIFNPFFDRETLFTVGGAAVSGGVVSMLTLMLKGALCLMASYLLIATTRIEAICAALRTIHVPSVMVTMLLLTFRYVTLIGEEAAVMSDAYSLRAPGQRGIHYKAWGSFLGQLLLRSSDRAGELYASMQLRGFSGQFPYAKTVRGTARDVIYAAVWIALFVLARRFDVTALIGGLMM